MAVVIDIATHDKFETDPPEPFYCPACGNNFLVAKVSLTVDMELIDLGEVVSCCQCSHTFNLQEVMEDEQR